jgi:hypothetical protein
LLDPDLDALGDRGGGRSSQSSGVNSAHFSVVRPQGNLCQDASPLNQGKFF